MVKTDMEQILAKAIQFEEDAHNFYVGAMGMVERPHIRKVLRELADQEVLHKERLEGLLAGDVGAALSVPKAGKVQDLKLAEYLVAPTLGKDATFQDVLIVAMKREESSHSFYQTMAGFAQDEMTRKLFEFLAQEELVHKNKVETLYDEVVYKEF